MSFYCTKLVQGLLIPEMTNTNNELTGFVWHYPRPNSETSSNSANVPDTYMFTFFLEMLLGMSKK